MSVQRLFLIVISILALSLVVPAYEVESEEEDNEYQENPPSSDESDESTDELTLTKFECTNALESSQLAQMCCHIHLHLDKKTQYCNENADFSDLDLSTENDRIQAIMRLVSCFFRKKKYIKSQNKVNMTQVQADAAKLHNPAKSKFLVKMYKTCENEGKQTLKLQGGYTQRRDMEQNLPNRHQVFMHVVYACVNNYFTEKECPYFYWFSEEYDDQDKCKQYAKECEKLYDV